MQIVTLIQTWNKLHDLHFAPPPVLECCFTAGTTHLLAYTCAKTTKKRFDALQRVRECIDLMKVMADTWPAARQKQDLLEGLLEQYSKDEEEQTEGQSSQQHEVKLEQDMLFEMPHLGLGDQADYNGFNLAGGDQGTLPNHTQDEPWRTSSASNNQARFHVADPGFSLPRLLDGGYSQDSNIASKQYAPPPLSDWIPDMGYGYPPIPTTGSQHSNGMTFAPPFDFDLAAYDGTNAPEWSVDQLALFNSPAWLEQANRQADTGQGAEHR